ncbi:hypothetical protein NDU88_000675 [Pleurodeles waltl]|uniref:Uncharacterized protein n=1 Tax=Pleurodeles waltl TaxID=8319 RepID=A0AAV7UQM9_PLEWA|nr:hypothetical protein NDU88_000675 [Pleurodeles waltl]
MGVILTSAGGGGRPPKFPRQNTAARSKDRRGNSEFPAGPAGDRQKEAGNPLPRGCRLRMEPRGGKGATGAVAPVAIFSVCYADTENLCGALLGGPCNAHAIGMGTAGAPRGPTTPVPASKVLAVKTARTRLAGRGSESPWRRCLQRRHGGFLRPGENRRETAGFPFLTAALPPRSELAWMHRQPVGGASAVPGPGGL